MRNPSRGGAYVGDTMPRKKLSASLKIALNNKLVKGRF